MIAKFATLEPFEKKMELKSKSIKVFCAVVESGSLLAAANKLSMSASAASRVITQLEDRLDFELFDRSNKTLSLTPAGTEFYRMAMESLRAWKLLEDFPKNKKSAKQPLRIAVLARHCSDVILPAVVKTLKHHADHLSVTMDVHQSRDIYYSKYSHPFDVGFGTLLSDHDDLNKVTLAHLPFRLVVSKQNPLFDKPVVTRQDYAKENFIVLSNDTRERHHCDRLMPQIKPEQLVAEVSSTQVALRMVARNVGVHLTDLLAAISVSRDCTAIPLDDPMTIPFFVFWPKSSVTLRPEIVECIAEIAKSIQSVGIPLTQDGLNFIVQDEKFKAPRYL